MKHAREDYVKRFQDPAGHPDCHVYDFLRQLAADAYEADRSGENEGTKVEATVKAFFTGNGTAAKRRLEIVRAFAARADIGDRDPVETAGAGRPPARPTVNEEATRAAVDAIALTFSPPMVAGEVISRRAFFSPEVGRWRVRLAVDSTEEPEMIFNVVDAEPGVEGSGLDLERA